MFHQNLRFFHCKLLLPCVKHWCWKDSASPNFFSEQALYFLRRTLVLSGIMADRLSLSEHYADELYRLKRWRKIWIFGFPGDTQKDDLSCFFCRSQGIDPTFCNEISNNIDQLCGLKIELFFAALWCAETSAMISSIYDFDIGIFLWKRDILCFFAESKEQVFFHSSNKYQNINKYFLNSLEYSTMKGRCFSRGRHSATTAHSNPQNVHNCISHTSCDNNKDLASILDGFYTWNRYI